MTPLFVNCDNLRTNLSRVEFLAALYNLFAAKSRMRHIRSISLPVSATMICLYSAYSSIPA